MSSFTRRIQKRLLNNRVPILDGVRRNAAFPYEKPVPSYRDAFSRDQIAFIGDTRITRRNAMEMIARFPTYKKDIERELR